MTGTRRLGNIEPGGPGFVGTNGERRLDCAVVRRFSREGIPRVARVVQRVDPNTSPGAIAVGSDAIWVADSYATTVTRIDPTGLLTPVWGR